MKKSIISFLTIASLSLLTGCFDSSNSNSKVNSTTPTSQKTSDSKKSDTTNSNKSESNKTNSNTNSNTNTSSSDSVKPEPVVKKASVSKAYNLVSDSTLNVEEGDELEVGENTFTLTFEEAKTNVEYEILVNKTVATMVASSDNKTFSYTYTTKEDEKLVIAVILKQKTNDSGYKITYTNGEHYTVLGITSGSKYKAYTDYEDYEQYDIKFAVIPDVGYHVKSVKLGDGDVYSSDGVNYLLTTYDYFDEDKTLTVEVEEVQTHSITYIGNTAENGVDVANSILPTTFTGYDKVNFKFIPLSGYSISNVTFSDSSIYSNDSFSDYYVTLPNEDVTVTITTAKAVNLKVQANDHIHDVEFYSGVNYSSDNKSVTPKDKITEFVPSDRNQFFVVFSCDEGYKPTSITGSVEDGVSGYNEGVKTTDGKYVFRTYLLKDCEIIINLTSKKTVSLDSSSTGVDLLFDGDVTEYYPGDSVGFDILKTDSDSNKKIGKVTYSFIDADNTKQSEEITPSSYSNHTYNFTMPDYNVTISVELITVSKVNLSYTNSATNYVKNVNFIKGENSSAKLDDSTTTSSDFEKGETVSIRLKLTNDHSKKIKVTFAHTSGDETEIELTPNYGLNRYEASFTLTEAGSISITASEDSTVRTLTTTKCEDSDIEFYTSTKAESKVASLGNLYDFDTFYVVVKDNSTEDRSLRLQILVNGVEIDLSQTKIGSETAFKVVVSGNVEIKVEVDTVETVSLTLAGVTDLDDDVLFDEDGEAIDTTSGKIEKGKRFYFDGDSCGVTESVTIGGVFTKPDYTVDHTHPYYTATDDVVITISYEE